MLIPMLVYMCLGALVGFLAGLLGIGGGILIVPILSIIFSLQGLPPEHTHMMALGTSMASIIFTALSSFLSHHKHGAVRWDVWKFIAPGIVITSFFGPAIASMIPTLYLKIFFVSFIFYVAIQMISNIKPKPSRKLPGKPALVGVGMGIGAVSSLVAIGGGTLTVPFLVWCNVRMQHAIGTSAAVGFCIALAGSFGYIISGLNVTGLPQYSFGFVYLPAFIGLVSMSVLTAPVGAKLTHTLPVSKLKKIFAFLLLALGTHMLVKLFI